MSEFSAQTLTGMESRCQLTVSFSGAQGLSQLTQVAGRVEFLAVVALRYPCWLWGGADLSF